MTLAADSLEAALTRNIIFALQIALGFVLFVALASKVRRPREFVRTIAAYQLLPALVASPTGYVVIGLEAFLVIAFVTGIGVQIAALIATLMLSIFAIAVGVTLKRGRDVACGCFGNPREHVSPKSLRRLGLLIGAAAAVAVFYLTGASPVGLQDPSNVGISVFAYALHMMTLAAFFVISGIWLLHSDEVVSSLHKTVTAQGQTRLKED